MMTGCRSSLPTHAKTPNRTCFATKLKWRLRALSTIFLKTLNKSVRGKAKQYDRMINVLWHCYLISDSGTQLEVAEMLGVSDSLVSDYRKRIEANLQQLSFSGVNEARQFEKALKRKVRDMITMEKEEVAA